jgi:hypothetical protein
MGCVVYICTECDYAASAKKPRMQAECPACGAQMVREFDEDGDHDEPEREEEE